MANEKRLIDAKALLRRLCFERDDVQIKNACDIGYHNGLNMAASMAINSPTVDAVEVVHGRWMKTKEPLAWEDVDAIECSNCYESWLSDEDDSFDYLEHWHYCPNCGAKMDGVGNG